MDRPWERCRMDFLSPHQKLCIYTHTRTYISIFKKVFFPYDYRTAESATPRLSDVPGGRTDLEYGHAAEGSCAVSRTARAAAKRLAAHGDLLFVLNPSYSATLLGPGAGRGSVGTM